jgi:hypothetical protein
MTGRELNWVAINRAALALAVAGAALLSIGRAVAGCES